MLLLEYQRLWTPTGGGEFRDLNVAPGQRVSGSCRFVTCSCLPAKLDRREGGNSTRVVHSQRDRHELAQQYFQNPTLWWDGRQDKKSSSSPDFRHNDFKEPFCQNNFYNSAWDMGGQQVVSVTLIKGPAGLTANATLHDNHGPLTVCRGEVTAHTVCEKGQLIEAVDALSDLVQREYRVSPSLLYSLLTRCVAEKNLAAGRRVHDLSVKLGYESSAFLGNHILRMYAWQGRLQEAMDAFRRVAIPDAFMWVSIISAHAKHGRPNQAIQLYHEMCSSGVKPTSHVFVAALQACAIAADFESGRQVHTDVLKSGIPPNPFVCTSLVDMYAKCGKCEDAHRLFDSLATKNVVTWNAMISGYAEHGLSQRALALYARMEQEGQILANRVTYICVLKACASVGALQQGKQLHSQILERGLLVGDVVLGNCLVDMYAKCGELEDARRLFDNLPTKNVVTWTTMIARYAEYGLGQEALALYARMQEEGLVVADRVTFACLLKACASVGALQEGKQLHSHILERGQLEGDRVLGSCLVDMYAKCGELEDARRVFDTLPTKNVVTWTAMITRYAEHGLGQEALALYARMEQEGLILADSVTFASLLKSCASAGALQQGRELHSQIVQKGLLEGDIVLCNCLVDMYAKCGKFEDARGVFDSLATKDVVTWNAMISGYGRSNEGHKAVACFEEMLLAGVQPDDTTFTCLLVACSHEGLVNEGSQYFSAMLEHHGVKPTTEHHNCMVDLLGRAGHLDAAEKMILLLETESSVVGLMSLLNACRGHGDAGRGTRCFERLVRLDPQHASAYILMANIYADAGRWADVDRIETLRKSAGASKKPAVAGVEIRKQVHTFVVGVKRDDLSCKVRSTSVRLKEEGGHVPQTKLVLKPLSENEKEDELCGHAEKLALAYGLLNTPNGTPLLVTKNLRMCRDCHSSTEIMSRIEKRDIVVRDAYRVHRFEAGSCSCKGRP